MVVKKSSMSPKRTVRKKELRSFADALREPSLVGWIVFAFAFYLWYLFVTWEWKLAVCCISVWYYFMETIYTTFVDYQHDGR